jgi:glycogen debranching enzyme
VTYRDCHGRAHAGNWVMDVGRVQYGVRITAFLGAMPFYLLFPDDSSPPADAEDSTVDACARYLLVTNALRSLAPDERNYHGRCEGDRERRDAAYHQGSAWTWLLGPFALAHFRIDGNAAEARAFFEPISHHLTDAGLGSVSEVFDGDGPMRPCDCIAQAWSVGEMLRTWSEIMKNELAPVAEGGP